MPVSYFNDRKADAAQEAAIRHFQGPCLVTAGPGSGKTFVLTSRAVFLTAVCKVPPEDILVLTFSRAAALAMRQRYLTIAPLGCEHVRFHTFHAFCYEVIKEYTGTRPGTVSSADQLRLIGSIRKRLAAAGEDRSFSGMDTEEIVRMVSRTKCGLRSTMPDTDGTTGRGSVVDAIRREYDACLRERGCMDFDDMILECVRLLSQHAGILESVRKRAAFLMVDEFQDVSPAQFMILRLLAGSGGNLFAVGDDDQGIYGFRGAGPGIFRAFLHHFPDTRILRLDINYRCPEEVIRTAGKVIRHNSNRFGKRIIGGSGCRGEVRTAAFTSRESQYEAIADTILGGAGTDSVGILLRMSGQARRLIRVLEARGIRYVSSVRRESHANATAAAFLKDLTAYAEASLHAGSIGECRDALLRILHRPERGICLPAGPGIPDPALDAFCRQLAFAGRLSAPHWYRYVMDILHYGDHFRRQIRPNLSAAEEEDVRKAKELCLTAASLEDLLHGLSDMADGLAAGGPDDRKAADRGTGGMNVQIRTMHTAKGLEFDTVFLPDLNEGIIPARAAGTKAAAEEERRLFYVAMTRARKKLYMSFLEDPESAVPPVSRFLKETETAYTKGRF